jgi:predicted phosphodiesterase
VDGGLPDALAAAGLPPLADEWTGTLAGVQIAATHGHRAHLVHRHLGQADLLLHGHTHRRRAERLGKTLVVNPGALHRCPRKTIALVHLPEGRVDYFEVTGEGVRAFHG